MNETTRKTLEQVVQEYGRYPLEAFEFVRQGLNHTVPKIHANADALPEGQRHVSGQQLCEGLREFAIVRYGLLAGVVLRHWGITRTQDFGNIVYAMVESKLMQKTDQDDISDFDDVYDFATAFAPPVRPQRKCEPTFRL